MQNKKKKKLTSTYGILCGLLGLITMYNANGGCFSDSSPMTLDQAAEYIVSAIFLGFAGTMFAIIDAVNFLFIDDEAKIEVNLKVKVDDKEKD